jgi:hypothetical protein
VAEAKSALDKIDSRFKSLSGRSMADAAREYGDESDRLQKEIDAQQAEIDRRRAGSDIPFTPSEKTSNKDQFGNVIKHKDRFRHNRLKCRDCERDDPNEKFKRYIRTRIYNCLKNHNKTKHSIDYLGCTTLEYSNYIFNYNPNYNLDNYGNTWHIDHVIPISKFDLNNQEEQLVAFNWRNTMPLSSRENLSKNNKIIKKQVLEHVIKLLNYNTNNKLDLPQVYINLFAKHLDAGNPLELLLPLTSGNICEELV